MMNWTKQSFPPKPVDPPAEKWTTEHDGWKVEVCFAESEYRSGSLAFAHPQHGRFYVYPSFQGEQPLPSLGNVAEVMDAVLVALHEEGVDLRAVCDRKQTAEVA